jgi:hypothetical protein
MNAVQCARWVVIAGLLAGGTVALATNYSSTGSGNWTAVGTWGGGGWPQNPEDTATINNGHTVTITSNVGSVTSVTIQPTGILYLNASGVVGNVITTAQTVVMASGATIRGDGDSTQSDISALYGTISVNGTANFGHGYGYLSLFSAISGTGTLAFKSFLTGNGNVRRTRLYGDNSGFNGDVTLASESTSVEVYHCNAFGSKPGLVITVPRNSGQENSRICLFSSSFSQNLSNIIVQAYPGKVSEFQQGFGTAVSNKVTLEGGMYNMAAGSPTAARYNVAEIALKAGTTNLFNKYDGTSANSYWYQRGQITGEGSLRVDGYNAHDETFVFEGNNAYSGGSLVHMDGNDAIIYLNHDNALGSGPAVLDSDTDSKVACSLRASLTMPNAFRGRGKFATGAYVLTTTGSIEPRDTGFATVTKNVGTIYFEDLKFGSDSDGCAYVWQYNGTTNDIIQCDTLTFGAATHTLDVEWLGSGRAPEGTYTLFGYGGADPAVPSFTVNGPPGMVGEFSVDAVANQVKMRLFTVKGTLVLMR